MTDSEPDGRTRSWLFAPADNPHRCEKALASAADQVIWDLEDAVAPAHKEAARLSLGRLLVRRDGALPRAWIRINSPLSEWGEADLGFLSERGALGRLVVPKADAASIDRLGGRVREGHWLLVLESARGLWDLARGLLRSPPGVSVRLAFGALDYALDLGIEPTGGAQAELLHARSEIVYLSRAQGYAPPVDSVHPGLADPKAVEMSARSGRAMGFAGKLAIHPAQIAPIHDAFAPDAERVAWARRVMAAVALGAGTVQVDGAMVDRPVIEQARRVLSASGEGEGDRSC